MIGLIKKDFLCMKKSILNFVYVIFLFVVFTIAGVWDFNFLSSFIVVIVCMLPYTIFSYDHAAKWDIYALTLPLSRRKIVLARYMTLLLMLASSELIACVFAVASALQGGDFLFLLAASAAAQIFAVLFNAILLPLMYRFGAERAKIIFFGVYGGLIFIGWSALRAIGGGIDEIKATFDALANLPSVLIITGLTALCVAALCVSYWVSVFFYERKEW